jgi:diaminopimelate epimerase
MKFWKMHGLGNDYIVIDNRDNSIGENELSRLARKLCERRFSVGADGLVLLCNSKIADAKMRIFNADGSEAEMCGNGIRCFAKYCYENNVVKKSELRIETLAGIKTVWLTISKEEVKEANVDMGSPILERSNIPMLGRGTCINEDLSVDGKNFKVTCLSVGNPHCVIFVDDVKKFPVEEIGPKIEKHHLFPNRVNVDFAQALNKKELSVRVWERGCGETLACGTGACASMVAGNLLKEIGKKAIVHLLGGDLQIEYSGSIFMSGSAEKVFEGELFLGVNK